MDPPNSQNPHLTTVAPHTKSIAENGHYISHRLSPLLSATQGAAPTKTDEFNASRSQSVADIQFIKDGTSVAVVLRDGHSVGVFKLHPSMSRHTTQVYDLYRGRTAAVVEDLDWARDGRWLAVGTWNRTIHIFPVNPYGGKSDIRSHMDGRVRNVDIIRQPRWLGYVDLRTRVLSAERPDAPLAFMLISAYSSGGGESAFFEGFSSPQDIRVSSSFDELVASAISSSVDNSNLPAILPMYPNGVPGSKSFRNSAYSHPNDGWDWGRRRRGYCPSGAVPLEFDEEDEDFIDRDAVGSSDGQSWSTWRWFYFTRYVSRWR
ncbi:hypothetical protein BDZ97DRAFT_2070678 [Flammula alnicola]|nr:hypothetical protein BDZ97DRAFT_2070678 [Flammula alnicola]